MASRDKQVYILAGVMVALVPLALVLPRWLAPADAGLAGGAVAAGMFLLGLMIVTATALILFLFSWFHRNNLSKTARMVGMAPFPVIAAGLLLLWTKMLF